MINIQKSEGYSLYEELIKGSKDEKMSNIIKA